MISAPSDIFPFKEAANLTPDPDPEVTLTFQEIEPVALALMEISGKAGKANLKIGIDLDQLPLRVTPVLPIVILIQ